MDDMTKEMCERDGGKWMEKDGTWMCDKSDSSGMGSMDSMSHEKDTM